MAPAEIVHVLAKTLAELRGNGHAKPAEPTAGQAIGVTEAASGYLVTASHRKPRRLVKLANARECALSSIRAGAARADVFALVRIDTAKRAAAWIA